MYFYFSGRYCLQTSCDLHPCQNGGVCSLTSYGYLCSCPQGFGGPHCSRRLLPCETQPCVNGICIEDKTKTDGYRCQCHLWWIGQSLLVQIHWYPSHPRNDPYEEINEHSNLLDSAWTSYSKLENLTSFNPQNSNWAKLELENTWKTRITQANTRNTGAKVELDTCSNSTDWNSMKLELNIKWAHSSTTIYHWNSDIKNPFINSREMLH